MVHSPSPRTYFAFPSFSLFFLSPSISVYLLVLSCYLLSMAARRSVPFFSASLFVDTIRRLLLSRSSFTVHIVVSLSPFGSCVLFFSISFSPTVYVYACMSICFSLFLSLFRPVVGSDRSGAADLL